MKSNQQKARHEGVGFSSGPGGYLINALCERTYSVGNHGLVFNVTLDGAAISNLETVIALVDGAFQAPAAPADQQPGS
jgi:hypothetical protein